MYRRRPGGLLVGMAVGAAIARPRNTVVVASPYPTYGYGAPVIVTGPPPPTQVVVAPPPQQVVIQQQQPAYPQPPPQQPPPPSYNNYLPPQPSYQPPPQPSYQPPPQQYPPQYPQAPGYQEKPYQGQAYPPPPPPQQGWYQAPPVEVVRVPEVRPPKPKAVRRYFLIVNEANCQVMELQYGAAKPGAKVVIGKRRPDKASPQSFYLDDEGVIRARLNEYAFESKSGGDHVVLMPYLGDARQQWVFVDNRIVNKLMQNDCIGLKKRLLLHDDADVIVSRYKHKPYQHWRMEYL